jgi:hypothetical protein
MNTTIETYVGTRSFERFERIVKGARENNHTAWIGDIPVTPELLAFFKALKAKRYNIIPCVDFNPSNLHKDGEYYSAFSSLGITYPDTEFRSGSIFMENSSKGDFEYCVMSEEIENEKYRIGTHGFTTRKSKDLAKALKLAAKFLQPLDHENIQSRCNGALGAGLETLRDPARSKLWDKLNINRDDIAQELTHMVALGYTPSTSAFKRAFETMATEGAELRRMEKYKPRSCFVWIKANSLSYKFKDEPGNTIECTSMDEVPELIYNKLAVLQIAKAGEAIADVGVRVSDKTYWIFA